MRYINLYRDRLENRGGILQRDRNLKILHREINTLAQGNPAYKKIIIDGVERYAVINRQDDYQIKEIVSMPGDFVPLGTYVTFADKVWLVEKTDYDTEVYSKSMMYMCNCHLKWRDRNGTIYDYPGVAEDATKYSVGVVKTETLGIADFHIKVKIKCDEITNGLVMRDSRFIIDVDSLVPSMIQLDDGRPHVFRTTRVNKVTGTIEGDGYFEVTMIQDQWLEGEDNYETMLAAQPWEIRDNTLLPHDETIEPGWV